jgi:hypothetical protein
MEEFGARDGPAVPVSLREIDGCRLFVGVYARRYGYVPPGSEKSVTELEYDEAERTGLPRLVFVVAPEYGGYPLIEANRDDTDGSQAIRLRRFLDRVAVDRVWDTFTTPEHLANRVAFAVSKWEGWRPAQLGPSRYRYVGRADLLRQLRAKMGASQRVALLGIGGIGKTLTAAEIARRMADVYSGGTLWVAFGTEARDPEQVLQATMRHWAECHHPGRLAEPSNLTPEVVRQWLAEAPGPVLVILDDVWHAPPANQVLRLIPDGVGVFLTTRRADVVRQLDFEPVTLERLAEEEAVAFLRDRVGDLPSLTSLRRIAVLLGGHPLALEIVAAQIASGPPDLAETLPDAISARLRDDPGQGLIGIEADLTPPLEAADADLSRYSSLSVALGLTYETFPEHLKRRFRATGVLAPDAPISASLLTAVWGDDLIAQSDGREVADRAAALVSAGVLTSDGTCFTRHPLVRLFALRAARQASEDRTVEDRYVNYVLERVLPRLDAGDPHRWEIDLGEYLPHIHFLGDRLAERLADNPADMAAAGRMMRFASGVEKYLEHRREVPGRQWLEAAASACRTIGDRLGEVRFTNALARFHYAKRDSQSGMRTAYDAWKLAVAENDLVGTARSALLIGYHYTHTDPWEAPRYFQAAAESFAKLGDGAAQAEALIGLSVCRADNINSPSIRREGFALLAEALRLARDTSSRLVEVRALIRLGDLHHTCAELSEARDQLQAAALVSREIGSQSEEAIARLGLAGVLADLGDLISAARELDIAEQLFSTIGDRVGRATTLRNEAQLAEMSGDPSRAAELYARALPAIRKRTMQERDAHWGDDMRAVRTLTVCLDDVLFNDTREQFRANLYRNLRAERGTDAAAIRPEDCQMPEDIVGFIVRQTIAGAFADESSISEWEAALGDFARRLDEAGPNWAVDADFARALKDVTAGRVGALPDEHTYHWYLTHLRERVRQRKEGVAAYGPDELQPLLSRTLAVRTTAKDKVRDWASQLRRMRRDAALWGEYDEAELLNALLGITVDRLASVAPESPYAAVFRQFQNHLGRQEELLLDYVERVSITSKLAGAEQLREWRAKMAESLQLATLWRQRRERDFLGGLLALLDGQPASLSGIHVYGPSLAYVMAAIAEGVGPIGMPAWQVRMLFALARDPGPEHPEHWEKRRRMFTEMIVKADAVGDAEEAAFFRAMLALMAGERAELPGQNRYNVYLERRMGIRL